MNSVNFGNNSNSAGDNSISIGNSSSSLENNSIAIGSLANSNGINAISIGVNSNCINNSISIGDNSKCNSNSSISFGYNSNTSNLNSISIGDQSNSTGENSISMGYHTLSTDTNSISIGDQAESSATNSIAMGYHSICEDNNSIALGDTTSTTKEYGVSMGYNCNSNGKYSISIGVNSNSNSNNSIVIGNDCITDTNNNIKLGNSNHDIIYYNTNIKINNYYPIPQKKHISFYNPQNGQIVFDGNKMFIYINSKWYFITKNMTLVDEITETDEYTNQSGLSLHKAINTYNSPNHPSGHNIIIAVSDTGIYPNHIEYCKQIFELIDCAGENFDYTNNYEISHGSHIAGIICANRKNSSENYIISNNMHGYAYKSNVGCIKLFNQDGNWDTTDSQFTDIINISISNNVQIINCSWGIPDWYADGYSSSGNSDVSNNYLWFPYQLTSYETAANNNIIHVFSSGNDAYKESGVESAFPILYPTHLSTSIVDIWISVISVSDNGKESYYTNRAGSICQDWTITAHGGDAYDGGGVNSVNFSGGYTNMQGTSMAAPSVSGGLAIIMENFPNLSSQECVNRLFSTATYSGLSIGTHLNYIDGLLDDYKISPSTAKYNNIKNKILGNNYGSPTPNTDGGKRYDDGSGTLIKYLFTYYITSEKLIDCLGNTNASFILKAIFGYGLMDLEAAIQPLTTISVEKLKIIQNNKKNNLKILEKNDFKKQKINLNRILL
jgi:hypothetical protein